MTSAHHAMTVCGHGAFPVQLKGAVELGHRLRPRIVGLLVVAVAVLASTVGTAGPASATSTTALASGTAQAPDTPAAVIVQAHRGHQQEAAVAVQKAGGQIGRNLPIVEGFAARLSPSAAHRLAGNPAIRQITPNSRVQLSMVPLADDDPAYPSQRSAGSSAPAAAYADPATEPAIASNYPKSTGATTAWADGERGAGITVAVIDTGISPVPDLGGRVVAGPDFSGERNSLADSYGHGTVMAGVIAGDGTSSASDPAGAYMGIAPEAKVLSVKVAGRSGATDVSTVLAAMQWVGSHRDMHNIRVVNLSWGTTSTQSPSVDPLNFAVQRLWRSGIAVVAAAGNDGPASGTITKPGDDPVIITAGAYNDRQNTTLSDDSVPAWSSRGPTAAGLAKPDVIAPGRTLIATRGPGSEVESKHPQALIREHYIRGSGTSQASAVVAGSVALLLGRRGSLRPDQVKHAVTASAVPIYNSAVDGHGRVSVPGMLQARVRSAPVQALTSSGLGSIDASRGGRHVETVCKGDSSPTRIEGEIDALCQPWDGESWAADQWTADSWSEHMWSGDQWTGDQWSGDQWSGDQWSGTEFLTAFWGLQTPWWQKLPGETAAARTAESPPMPGADE